MCVQCVTGEELPLLDLGFCATSEFLQKVPGVQVMCPPGGTSVLAFSTHSHLEEEDKVGQHSTKDKVTN